MKLTKAIRALWRAAGLTPQPDAIQRNGIVCLHADPDLPDPKRAARLRAKGGTLVGMLIREQAADRGRDERLRVMALLAKEPKPVANSIDRGAQGPAASGRPRQVALHRGKPVGVAVLTHPLDVLHHAGRLDDRQHAAGSRLRAAIEGSWPQPDVTARPMYVSEQGDHDEPEETATDEERADEQRRLHGERLEAERIVGRRDWPTLQHVCAGGAVISLAALSSLQTGLTALAQSWKSAKPQKGS